MYKSNYESVKDFHQAFKYTMPSEPSTMTKEMVLNRTGFDGEETVELLHATSNSESDFRWMFEQYIERLEQAYAKQVTKPFPKTSMERLIGQTDALLDKRYFNSGDFTLLAIDPDPLFEIVHVCNMQKLWPDGEPRYNEHGKIMKPEGWEPPEAKLEAEIKRQIEVAK